MTRQTCLYTIQMLDQRISTGWVRATSLEKATAGMSKRQSKPPPRCGRSRRALLARHFNDTWRQGELPSGQTAKARPGYRVQSLQNGHAAARPIKSKHDPNHAQHKCLSRCRQLRGPVPTATILAVDCYRYSFLRFGLRRRPLVRNATHFSSIRVCIFMLPCWTWCVLTPSALLPGLARLSLISGLTRLTRRALLP